MKLTLRDLKHLIKESMSKEEIIGKLGTLTGELEDQHGDTSSFHQGMSLADALPDPETLDPDNTYEYRRRIMKQYVDEADELYNWFAGWASRNTSPDKYYTSATREDVLNLFNNMTLSEAILAAFYYHAHDDFGMDETFTGYEDANELEDDVYDYYENRVKAYHQRFSFLDGEIRKMVSGMGTDPVTAHISSL